MLAAERAGAGAWMQRILVFGSLLALFLLLITRNVSPEPYGYDEADYMYAATFGFAANWTDAPSISMADFVRAGLNRESPKALSERIRGSHDVLFYRHFHGPLYHYFLIPVSRLPLNPRAVRMLMLAIPAASLAILYFGCLWLVPGPMAPLSALLAAMLFLTSHAVVWSTELAPHQLFALCSLACLILLAKAIATGRRACWYACCHCIGARVLHARSRFRFDSHGRHLLLRRTAHVWRGSGVRGQVARAFSCDCPGRLAFRDSSPVICEGLRGGGVSRTDARGSLGPRGIHRNLARARLSSHRWNGR